MLGTLCETWYPGCMKKADRKGYPTDVSDEEWSFAAAYLTLMDVTAPQRKYELMRDLAPIAPVNYSDLVIVVHPSVPAKTLAEFIALARVNFADVFSATDEPLRQQKPGGKFIVVSGRSHRDADGPAAYPDFQRLLDDQGLRPGDGPARGEMLCAPTRRHFAHYKPITSPLDVCAGGRNLAGRG